jgi:hypothetical protein
MVSAMVGIRDFFDAFKGGMSGGETGAGHWRNLEQHGRFSGMGEAEAQLELPQGKIVISNEEIREIEGFEIELTGPDGEPVALERFPNNPDHTDMGMHNLFRMAEAEVKTPGIHHVRVKGTEPGQELVIVVGEELSAKDAMLGGLTGRGPIFERPDS